MRDETVRRNVRWLVFGDFCLHRGVNQLAQSEARIAPLRQPGMLRFREENLHPN